MPWGLAVLLGAVLAPTDPVLASDIQVQSIEDGDGLRVALSGEAGLNDGTAFPFIMLGLGWMGLHELGAWGGRWFAQSGPQDQAPQAPQAPQRTPENEESRKPVRSGLVGRQGLDPFFAGLCVGWVHARP